MFSYVKAEGILSVSEQAGNPDKLSTGVVRNLAETAEFGYYKMYGKE